MFVCQNLTGDYDCECPQGRFRYHEGYGSVFLSDPWLRGQVALHHANEKVRRRPRELQDIGPEVDGRDSRFGGALLPT